MKLTTAQRYLLDLVRTSVVIAAPMPSTRTLENRKLLHELEDNGLIDTVSGPRERSRVYFITFDGIEALDKAKKEQVQMMSSESSAKPKSRSTHGASKSMPKKTSKRALKADPPKDYSHELPLKQPGMVLHVSGRKEGLFLSVEDEHAEVTIVCELTPLESEDLQLMVQIARAQHLLIKKASQ